MIAPGVRITVVGDVMLDDTSSVRRVGSRRRRPSRWCARSASARRLVGRLTRLAVQRPFSQGPAVRRRRCDAAGRELEQLLSEGGVSARFVSSATRQTIRKTRIFAGHHQVARVDHETISALDPDDEGH